MKFRRIAAVVLAFAVSACGPVWAEESAAGESALIKLPLYSGSGAEGEFDGYIVKLRDDVVTPYSLRHDVTALGENLYAVENEETAYTLAGPGGVESIEPNYRVEMYGAPFYNDAHYSSSLWHLKEAGLGMEDAWKWQDSVIASGGLTGRDVKVAVLDSGYTAHNDIDGGKVLAGINATTDGGTSADVNHHGTMVSGIIAAKANNKIGVVGVSHEATLLPIRVFDKDGHGYISYIVAGIQKAIDNGADIINMSLGATTNSTALSNMVKKALDAGIIIVAAVGNDGTAKLNYPAAYNGVVGVGALEPDGTVAQYSQKNASVWITAPGSEITSTYSNRTGYATGDGTSFAAPCVTGLAAIAKQYAREHKQSLTPAEFSTLLRLTGGRETPDYSYGYGAVTAGRMLGLMREREIKYNSGGGELPADCVSSYIPYSSQTVILPIPAREDYFFAGWYESDTYPGSPVTAFVPSGLAKDKNPVYYAKWIENITELSAITLDGWAAEDVGNKEWRVYLPSGTPIPTGIDCVKTTFAYSGSQSSLGCRVTDHGGGRWTIAVTQDISNSVFEDTYTLVADNTTYPAPTLAAGQEAAVTGTAVPASLGGRIGAIPYTGDAAKWFSNATFFTLSDFRVNGERVETVVGLELSQTGALRYVPPAAAEGQTITFAVMASNDRFSGASVTVAVQVGELPLSVPTLSSYEGKYDADTPAPLTLGFTPYRNTLSSITDSRGNTLSKDADYTVRIGQQIVDGEVQPAEEVSLPASVTLSGDYLTKLDNGRIELLFHFSTGRDAQPFIDAEPFVLTVTNSLAHSYTVAATEKATCTQPGYETYECRTCGSQKTEELPALGHEYGEWSEAKVPTCTEEGEKIRICSRCEDKETEAVDALGHSYQNGICTNCQAADLSQSGDDSSGGGSSLGGGSSGGSSGSDVTSGESSGGGGSLGSSSGSASSGGGFPSGGSFGEQPSSTERISVTALSSPDTVIREEKGAVITTKRDPVTGTVTETTEYPDGSSLRVETKTDGTVTTIRQDSAATVTTVRLPGENPAVSIELPDRSSGVAVSIPTGKGSDRRLAREAETGRILPLCLTEGENVRLWTDRSVRFVLEEPTPKTYSDMTQRRWWSDAVGFVSDRELFVGTPNGTFAPEERTLRAQILTVFSRIAGEQLENMGGTWYDGAMSWAARTGLSDGKRPGDPITREETVTLLWRWAGCPEAGESRTFADADRISRWAAQAVAWGVEEGLIRGRTADTFVPQGYTTRAEAAILFQRLIVYKLQH